MLMTLVDWIGGNKDEKLAQFSLILFRNRAWDIAQKLFDLQEDLLQQQILELDHQVSKENHWFTDLGSHLMPPLVRISAMIQNKKAGAVIKAFNAIG